MKNALALSVRELGNVWPNPAVGCVLVKGGEVVGFGWTQPGGRPHAEFMALKAAGDRAKGATAFVTLEPCAHEGKTPSCARLLAEAGVKRVVYAVKDPDPRTRGKGADFLKKQGIEVSEGLFRDEATRLNQGFFTRVLQKRPMVTLKLAVSGDGKIAKKERVRTRITGPEAGLFTQKLRAKYDAILIGVGTVLADNPDLTCRIKGFEDHSPVRIVMDRELRIPPNSRLVTSAQKSPVWLVTEVRDPPPDLVKKGVEIVSVKDIKNIKQVLEIISKKGITRLLVEGGADIAASFHASGLLDYVYVLKNPALELGPGGVPAFRDPGILAGGKIAGFEVYETKALGQDTIDFYRRRD